MQRISNRHSQSEEPIIRYVYVEVAAEAPEVVQTAPEVQIVEREVIKEVHVPGETVVIHKDAEPVDLSPIHKHLQKNEEKHAHVQKCLDKIATELELQRQALVSVKIQRHVDRSRRLTFMKRVKKERDQARKLAFKLKLAIGASLILSIVSLIVKL